LGLIFREEKGPGSIGRESVVLLCTYVFAIAVQVFAGRP
jgi:cation:H+ antiporter